jgi:hypothetical protein
MIRNTSILKWGVHHVENQLVRAIGRLGRVEQLIGQVASYGGTKRPQRAGETLAILFCL